MMSLPPHMVFALGLAGIAVLFDAAIVCVWCFVVFKKPSVEIERCENNVVELSQYRR